MGEVIMELQNVTKYFPGVIALNDMSFQIRTGEVHGLIGENGAGKSTLIKVFTGVNQPEKGKIIIDGKRGSAVESQYCEKIRGRMYLSGTEYCTGFKYYRQFVYQLL